MSTRANRRWLPALALLLWPPLAAAQQAAVPQIRTSDSVTIAANRDYEAGSLVRLLLGDQYRDLWAEPIRVPVLDLANFAGGLTPVESGGRKQTLSLRFEAADGREFVVRSVDKDPLLARSAALEGTLGGRVVRDQTSASFRPPRWPCRHSSRLLA
ncbi:MAG: hypothetical protein GEU90_02890 [Gemmatimonas sp.]|nr:hypothetical protein [Gemmatimonas sp.]